MYVGVVAVRAKHFDLQISLPVCSFGQPIMHIVLYFIRECILAVEFGTHPILIVTNPTSDYHLERLCLLVPWCS